MDAMDSGASIFYEFFVKFIKVFSIVYKEEFQRGENKVTLGDGN